MYAVIDIGSNTVRMSIYKFESGEIKFMFNKKYMIGLAGYIDDNGNLNRQGMEKAIDALNSFKKILNNIEVKKVYAFATASLRNILNSDDALFYIKEKSGFDIKIISGEEEARLDFIGATQKIENEEGILVDIGGGSTEIVFYKEGKIIKAVSIPIGSLNMYSKFVSNLLPKKSEKKKIEEFVLNELKKVGKEAVKTTTIRGVGGTVRASCKLNNNIFDYFSSNTKIPSKNINKMTKMFDEKNKNTFLEILKTVPERIHTIVPGMVILNTVAKFYNIKTIEVSKYGIREGYLIENI